MFVTKRRACHLCQPQALPRGRLPRSAFAVKVAASVRTAEEEDMTDGDKIAAAVMAASLCSKVNANPDEYVQNYFDILQKMSQQEGAAQQRRWNAPKS